MAKRDARISLYVTEETKRDLQRRADDEDVSLSNYLRKLIDRQMVMEAEDEVSAQTRATERLQRVIDDGQRDLREVAREIADMNAKMGAYAIALFELEKRNHGEAEIRKALSTGSRRLRDDADPQEAVPDAADQSAAERPESTADDDLDDDLMNPFGDG